MDLTTRWRFLLCILLLQIPVWPVSAADKRLAAGHVPAVVAHGNVIAAGRLPGTNELRLALALPLRNTAELTNLLTAIYNPGSVRYHHYLTPQEFAARFGPTPADYAAIIQFANTNGLAIQGTHPNRLVVDVAGPVASVERALHVRLYSFRHPTEPRNFFAPDAEPTVDARLPLLQVGGLNNFSLPHPNVIVRPQAVADEKRPQGGSSPEGTYMGNDFRQAYVPGTELTGAGQSVGLLDFDGFEPDDIASYEAAIGLTNSVPQVVVMPVDGGVTYTGANIVEVTLDIEMVLAMAPGVSNIYVYEAPNGTPWLDMLSQMADDNLASQLSCSWNGGGPDPASEQVFLQMATQGQTFFNATGDTGAFTNLVDFPSASPNVTEVGGTYLVTDTNGNYLAETAWNRGAGFAGSGGICPLVGIPPWQLGLDMTTNNGSTIWRNVPDVALAADDVYIICDGQGGLAAGTSCAAPLWAGLTALINQQAAQIGQPPVGLLNPALYALGQGANYAVVFHDITSGNNTNFCNTANFYAGPGFDLCTGWGTPTGTNLVNALTTPDYLGILPPTSFSMSALAGGPFAQTNWIITVTNSGPTNLDWALGSVPAWLTVSTVNGTLAASDSTNVVLQLADAAGLPAGDYYAVVQVTNVALARVQNVVLQVEIRQNLVENGGFETGDFSGWTLVGNTVALPYIYNVVGTDWNYPGLVHSGNYGAFLGQSGYAATLSETLVTTPGQIYLVSWWLNNQEAVGYQSFSVGLDGTNYFTLEAPPDFAWTNLQFVAMASSTNALLQFAAESDDYCFCLDDVSVLPVPPPVFTSCCISTNGCQLAWPSLAGLNYLVQYKTNLAQGDWLDLGIISGGTNVTTFADPDTAGASDQRYYRLVLAPPW